MWLGSWVCINLDIRGLYPHLAIAILKLHVSPLLMWLDGVHCWSVSVSLAFGNLCHLHVICASCSRASAMSTVSFVLLRVCVFGETPVVPPAAFVASLSPVYHVPLSILCSRLLISLLCARLLVWLFLLAVWFALQVETINNRHIQRHRVPSFHQFCNLYFSILNTRDIHLFPELRCYSTTWIHIL